MKVTHFQLHTHLADQCPLAGTEDLSQTFVESDLEPALVSKCLLDYPEKLCEQLYAAAVRLDRHYRSKYCSTTGVSGQSRSFERKESDIALVILLPLASFLDIGY